MNTDLIENSNPGRHRGDIIDFVEGFDVIDCNGCGFKHILPVPTADELESIYRDDYYTSEKPLYIDRHKEDLAWWNEVYAERYETLAELLPSQQRSLLDIGSGPGYFLLYGQRNGWRTLGIEPSRRAATYSRGLGVDVLEMTLDESSAHHLTSYDVIHMSNVLEHIPDPRAMVRIARSLLRDSGLMCIVVPNDYNPFQYTLRAACDYHPWWLAPPHHINYFDFDSLQRLLTGEGFDIETVETTFPIDLFLLMGEDYVGNDEVGRTCHKKRMRFEQALRQAGQAKLKKALYRSLAELGIGREIVVYARRGGSC